jgi:hypothetical protein
VSFAEVLLIATATAVSVFLATLILSKLVRAVVGSADLAAAQRESHVRKDETRAAPSFVPEPASEAASGARAELPEKRVASYVPAERSFGVKHLRRERAEPRGARVSKEKEVPMSEDDAGRSYVRLGEEVSAVLSAAEHAAVQIRKGAAKQAEETRRTADENAAATLAEAQATRAEADAYERKTRTAADKYAEATRRKADDDAAGKLAQAEQQAQQVLMDAKKKADDLLADAARRRDALTEHTADIEGRIESMVASFRGVTSELEAMLSVKRSSETTAGEPSDESLDHDLKRTVGDRPRTYAEP